MGDYPGRLKAEDIFLKTLKQELCFILFLIIESDTELRITEKMDFIPVKISVRIKHNKKADKSRRAVEKPLRGQLSSAGKCASVRAL